MPAKLTAERVEFEPGLKWLSAESIQRIPQGGTKIGMLTQEFASAPLEASGRNQREAHASSASRARISASTPP